MMNETPAIVETEPLHIAFIHLTIPREGMPKVMPSAVQELKDVLTAQGLAAEGQLFAHHHRMTPEVFDFDLCLPVSGRVTAAGRVRPGELPASKVVRTVYHGPYEGLPRAWQQFDEWIAAAGYVTAPDLIERYLAGPVTSPDPADWRTELNRPLAGQPGARS